MCCKSVFLFLEVSDCNLFGCHKIYTGTHEVASPLPASNKILLKVKNLKKKLVRLFVE